MTSGLSCETELLGRNTKLLGMTDFKKKLLLKHQNTFHFLFFWGQKLKSFDLPKSYDQLWGPEKVDDSQQE